MSDKSHSLPHCTARAVIKNQGFLRVPTRYAVETHQTEQPRATWTLKHTLPLCMGEENNLVCRAWGQRRGCLSQGTLGDFGMKPSNNMVAVSVVLWYSQEMLTITAQRVNLGGHTNQENRATLGRVDKTKQNKKTILWVTNA